MTEAKKFGLCSLTSGDALPEHSRSIEEDGHGDRAMNLVNWLRGRTEKDVFATAVLKRAKKQGHHNLRYDRERFALVTAEGEPHFLDSAYLANAPAPVAPELLDTVIDGVLISEADMSYAAVRDRIVPVVGNRAAAQFNDLTYEYAPAARRPLADFLEIHFVIERKLSARVVSKQDVQDWGIPFDEILAVAINNMIKKPAFPYKPMKGGFYLLDIDDQFVSSRILLPKIFDQLQLKGEPVVVPVSRTCVAFAGRGDHQALDTMARFVDDILSDEPRPVACAPIVRDNDTWIPLTPHPADSSALRHLVISHSMMDYELQTHWMQAASARDSDLKVAAFNVAKDGRSWAEWRRDQTTLLPKTDALLLADPSRPAVLRTWEDAEKVLGPFKAEPELYPPRYRVPAWSLEAGDHLATEFGSPPWLFKD